MNEIEATGRTVDEAVESALTELDIKKDNAKVEVKEEPSQGILGIIGSKNARVVVKPLSDQKEYLEKYIKDMLKYMDIEGSVHVTEDDEKLKAEIFGEKAGILIGRRGRILSEIQYLISVIVRRQFSGLKKMVVVDIENYRDKREKTLSKLAKSVAQRVSKENCEQALEPMSPQERRIIHLALQDFPGIKTYSSGEEPYRKVVITPH